LPAFTAFRSASVHHARRSSAERQEDAGRHPKGHRRHETILAGPSPCRAARGNRTTTVGNGVGVWAGFNTPEVRGRSSPFSENKSGESMRFSFQL
jgi:hypothetical protein